MKYQKDLLCTFWIITLLMGCRATSSFYGVYKSVPNGVISKRLFLNSDHSFVEYISSHMGGTETFFGFYQKKGRHVYLTQRSGDLNFLRKRDTVIYNCNPYDTGVTITALYNERIPMSDAEISFDGKDTQKLDANGKIRLPAYFPYDSIRIKGTILNPAYFAIHNRQFNQLFISVYDYGLTSLTLFDFETHYKINRRGLLSTTRFYIVRSDRKTEKRPFLLYRILDENEAPVKQNTSYRNPENEYIYSAGLFDEERLKKIKRRLRVNKKK